ncbi:hypothetical protein PRIC1_012668 [Phytophthora ramorum]
MDKAQGVTPFLVACDDAATVEAALSLLENCDDPIPDHVMADADQNLDATLADLSEFLDVPVPKADSDKVQEPSSPCDVVAVSSEKVRRRVTPKQEIETLRQQERELACRLENLRLQAYDQKLQGSATKNGKVLPFWKKIASRQYQSRLDSERENRRLRSLVMLHVGRAKRMKLAWKKQMTSEQGYHDQKPTRSELSNGLEASDTPKVMSQLTTDVDAVYVGLDAFVAGVWQEHRSQLSFLENSEAYSLPFERQDVDRAMWHSLGSRFSMHQRHVNVDEDTITCHVLRSFRVPRMDMILRIRWVAKKYREADRTVVITRALVEPQNLPIGANVGFRETQVSIVSGPRYLDDNAVAALTSIDTRMSVTCSGPEGGNGDGMRAWAASSEAADARNAWMHAFQIRKNAIEDRLFEETRQ